MGNVHLLQEPVQAAGLEGLFFGSEEDGELKEESGNVGCGARRARRVGWRRGVVWAAGVEGGGDVGVEGGVGVGAGGGE